jgi:hypothetical protein
MKKRNNILVWILIILTFIGFIKMCSVTVNNTVEREPLREIDNWR